MPLFGRFDLDWASAAFVLVMLAIGVVGLIRFGFTAPEVPAMQLVGVDAVDWGQKRWINQWSILWATGSRSARCGAI